jgi:hypothetical protein
MLACAGVPPPIRFGSPPPLLRWSAGCEIPIHTSRARKSSQTIAVLIGTGKNECELNRAAREINNDANSSIVA